MHAYKAPLRDMRFVLHELHGSAELAALDGQAELTADLIDDVLEQAASFTETVLAPLNAGGDREGCRYEGGIVRTPKGFREAYDAFRRNGWSAAAGDPAYGGQGLPASVCKLVEEMICSANLSFGLYPGLTNGACAALAAHGSAELKSAYLPRMISGEWSGTMCLTEPHCGTDLGLLRTRAVPRGDGSHAITGSKIFISAGEHDLTDNIVHLVLARLPEAPKGVRGISLFVVPKFLPDADGAPGSRNGVSCAGIERKMGIHASATCQMTFDGAVGWLVGEPHKGMRAMFTMMNSARVSVGTQGLGVAEAARQAAVAYARERRQGRALSGAKQPGEPADPIIVHPDVRRMLMTARAWTEGCRALCSWVARALDEQALSPDAAARAAAADRVALMTPIVKALFTDLGFEVADLAVQVYGGHGYIRDNGVEQLLRDARIARIYEGTNGVQALDLVGRKMSDGFGRPLRTFFHPVLAFIDAHLEDDALADYIGPLAKSFGVLQQATAHVAASGLRDPEEAGAAATDYLRLFGLVALAYMWARTAKIALEKRETAGPDAAFYDAKLVTARFYMERLLPRTGALWAAIRSGKGATMALADDMF
ncbi:MAG: acyl-CoA dehydrogenase C-terminal domain-containing protein [Pseudochelatococcus sp.]|jgi:alkylation response protein AidB-like acyl-CoA dehydrogenase|uniref:acyl-CoA dehydrogenase C-terminal domain-containing protein n=1 Tax=Pseudochelatococcus sp. TaxID=2020869 RepID=UPI003D93705D